MEFNFNCEKVLGTDAEGYAIIDGSKGLNQNYGATRAVYRAEPNMQNHLYDIIDKMGAASSKA